MHKSMGCASVLPETYRNIQLKFVFIVHEKHQKHLKPFSTVIHNFQAKEPPKTMDCDLSDLASLFYFCSALLF